MDEKTPRPRPLRENPRWRVTPPHGRPARYRLRLWRTAPGHLVVVITESHRASFDTEKVIAQLAADHPDDAVEVIAHSPAGVGADRFECFFAVGLEEGRPWWRRIPAAEMIARFGPEICDDLSAFDGGSSGCGSAGGIVETVVTVVATASLLPLVQAITTKAGEDVYAALRSLLLLRRKRREAKPDDATVRLISQTSGTTLVLPVRLPPDALHQLKEVDLDHSDFRGQVVSWDYGAGRWVARPKRRYDDLVEPFGAPVPQALARLDVLAIVGPATRWAAAQRALAEQRRVEAGPDGLRTWIDPDHEEQPDGVEAVIDCDGDTWRHGTTTDLRGLWQMDGYDPDEHDPAYAGWRPWAWLIAQCGPLTELT